MLGRMLAAPAVLLCLAVPPARAQDLADLCRRAMHPPVGAWSQFSNEGGRMPGSSMRIAVVGQETRGGTAYLWMEFAIHGMSMGRGEGGGDTVSMINRMLVRGFGPGMAAPVATIMKFGSAPAMEMPVNGPGMQAPSSNSLKDCTTSKVVGWESVTVPAGTFRALHVQDADGTSDTWVAPDLPFGMVKTLTPDSGQLVLVAHGMGAKSEITETPRPYDQAVFMQLMQQMMMRQRSH
ncbi:MAG TPA: hypothetical protein VMF70_07630 [Gemmatimonadales bacterium]|nr:hypothetical protein [Gemmatimonadales bacterium]